MVAIRSFLVLFAALLPFPLRAEKGTLETHLDNLAIPDGRISPALSEDQIFIVNTRYSSLIERHEVSLLGGGNFTADSHLSMQLMALTYRYHLNDSWSFGGRFSRYSTSLSSAGEALLDNHQIVPDTDYALNAQEVFANYHTTYGKIRVTPRQVMYFDQYVALGLGVVELSRGRAPMGLLDLGFAFWPGGHASVRLGLKNEGYWQEKFKGQEFQHNMMGYVEIGWLFGQGERL